MLLPGSPASPKPRASNGRTEHSPVGDRLAGTPAALVDNQHNGENSLPKPIQADTFANVKGMAKPCVSGSEPTTKIGERKPERREHL
jgi:hypothetical protein